MGEKDISEKQLEEYNDVFADIMNVLLFDGEDIIDPDDLSDAPTFSTYHDGDDEKVRKLERDVAKYWKSENVRLSYIGIENQSSIYKYMPLRIIGYDGTFYRNALNNHEDKKTDEQQFEIVPVVTMVLYFGYERRWTKPLTLKECFDIPPKLDSYVSDYKMNVFEIAWLENDTIAKFKSDFRLVADYFRNARVGDKWQPPSQAVRHVLALLDFFRAHSGGDERFRLLFSDKERRKNQMPSIVLDRIEKIAFDKGIEQGIGLGIEQGIEQGIGLGIEQGIEQGIGLGIEQGIEQGFEQKTIRFVTNLLKNNYSYETIAGLAETSIERVSQIADNLKNKTSE